MGVDLLVAVAETKRSVRPAVGAKDRNPSVFSGCRNPQRSASLAPHGSGRWKQLELHAIAEPEFVAAVVCARPLFSRSRCEAARATAAGSCKFRIVRLVRRQTKLWSRSSTPTRSPERRTPLSWRRYSAKRGAVQRVKA